MAEDPDPPPVAYTFKPKDDFARANTPTKQPSEQPTDVRELFKIASLHDRPLKVTREPVKNDIHKTLEANIAKDKAAGLYDITPGVDTRKQRRLITFWIPLALLDIPLVALYRLFANDRNLVVVLILGAGALTNLYMVWYTWVLAKE